MYLGYPNRIYYGRPKPWILRKTLKTWSPESLSDLVLWDACIAWGSIGKIVSRRTHLIYTTDVKLRIGRNVCDRLRFFKDVLGLLTLLKHTAKLHLYEIAEIEEGFVVGLPETGLVKTASTVKTAIHEALSACTWKHSCWEIVFGHSTHIWLIDLLPCTLLLFYTKTNI